MATTIGLIVLKPAKSISVDLALSVACEFIGGEFQLWIDSVCGTSQRTVL